jgi:hypothetical protein
VPFAVSFDKPFPITAVNVADEKVTFRLIRRANTVYCALTFLFAKYASPLRLQGRLRFSSSHK